MSDILFADDDPSTRQMVADLLRAAGYIPRLAADGTTALREARRSPPDLAVLDYRMGVPNGLEVCRQLKHDPRLAHIPVLILTGEGTTEDRIHGFQAGADDYLPKPFDPRELVARIQALLRLTQQGLDRNPTTGLPGGDAIRREYARRIQHGAPFSLCYFDLDHFKPFADRFGFSVADRTLQMVAAALQHAAAPSDAFTGHVGGDDFLAICDRAEARPLAETAQREFRTSLRSLLPTDVLARGTYHGKSREGERREFPITRLTVAIVSPTPSRAPVLDRLSEHVAEAKQRAKLDASEGIVEVEVDEEE